MDRKEHLAWAKQRALEYVNRGDLQNAFASMCSDLRKHAETDTPALSFLALVGMERVSAGDAEGVRHWIEGFQ